MEGQSKSRIVSLMERLNLSNEDLEAHSAAWYQLSQYGSPKAVDKIPKYTRDKIAEFYAKLREHGIYDYNWENGKYKQVGDYYDCWTHDLRNDKNRPEMQNVTREQVITLIQNGVAEVKKLMEHTAIREEYVPEVKQIGELLPF